MKVGDSVYIIDRNRRNYSNRKLDKESHVQEALVIKETNQSFYIKYQGIDYRYSKKEQLLVMNKNQSLYGIDPTVYRTKEEALAEVNKVKVKKEITPPVKKDYTEIKCDNGKVIRLEHKYLDEDFLEGAFFWGEKNGYDGIESNTFFTAKIVEEYIKATGTKPIYE